MEIKWWLVYNNKKKKKGKERKRKKVVWRKGDISYLECCLWVKEGKN